MWPVEEAHEPLGAPHSLSQGQLSSLVIQASRPQVSGADPSNPENRLIHSIYYHPSPKRSSKPSQEELSMLSGSCWDILPMPKDGNTSSAPSLPEDHFSLSSQNPVTLALGRRVQRKSGAKSQHGRVGGHLSCMQLILIIPYDLLSATRSDS